MKQTLSVIFTTIYIFSTLPLAQAQAYSPQNISAVLQMKTLSEPLMTFAILSSDESEKAHFQFLSKNFGADQMPKIRQQGNRFFIEGLRHPLVIVDREQKILSLNNIIYKWDNQLSPLQNLAKMHDFWQSELYPKNAKKSARVYFQNFAYAKSDDDCTVAGTSRPAISPFDKRRGAKEAFGVDHNQGEKFLSCMQDAMLRGAFYAMVGIGVVVVASIAGLTWPVSVALGLVALMSVLNIADAAEIKDKGKCELISAECRGPRRYRCADGSIQTVKSLPDPEYVKHCLKLKESLAEFKDIKDMKVCGAGSNTKILVGANENCADEPNKIPQSKSTAVK